MSTMDQEWEDTLPRIGLPSRKRYNVLVARAADQAKFGGDPTTGQVWATLALAEATLLAGED